MKHSPFPFVGRLPHVRIVLAVSALGLSFFSAVSAYAQEKEASVEPTTSPATEPTHEATGPAAIFKSLPEIKWDKILPDLGDSSPEIAILHVDPKTQATKLLIRSPKAIHVRKHWHTANETHTIITGTVRFECDGKKVELGPGSFNFMPAKMVHEAWLPANSLTFITVDGAWDVNWVEGPPTSADLSRSY